MKSLLKLAAVSALAFAAAGCTTTFEAQTLDAATGRFEAAETVPPESIKVRRPFAVDGARGMVFVRSNLAAAESYDVYFEESLRNMGFFGQVLRKDDFERMLVRDNHAAEVPSVDGFAGLARAAQIYGEFLVVDFDVEADVGYQVDVKMVVYSASNAEELLRVEHGVTNWAGLDNVLFQPTFNVLIDWLDENSPTYPASAAPAAQPGS